jgi:hypothetical protein
MLEFFNHYLFLPTLVVIIFLAQILRGTQRVWRLQRFPAAYNLQPVDLATTVDVHKQKAPGVIEAMATKGFVPFAASAITNQYSQVSFVLLRNPDDLSVASVTFASNAKSSFSSIEFTQLFADGSGLDVNSNPMVRMFPSNARKPGYRFPAMAAPELYAAFVKLRASLLQSKSPVLSLDTQDPVTALSRRLDEETVRLVSRGYLHGAVEEGMHRLTVKGALSFTVKLTSPWSEMINLAERAKARHALETAGSQGDRS